MVERKSRHLVEIARTLLLHHKVPQRFWGDAILAACYLINRIPSSVLHDKIPYSVLFPNQPLFYLPPHVFDCVCFVHILTVTPGNLYRYKLGKIIMTGICIGISYGK